MSALLLLFLLLLLSLEGLVSVIGEEAGVEATSAKSMSRMEMVVSVPRRMHVANESGNEDEMGPTKSASPIRER